MTDNWKQQHANAADAAVNHELTQDTIAELLDNLGLPPTGLPAYGIAKVAHVAAQVARAQALGFDPNLLRLTSDEAESAQLDLAVRAVFAGVPVTMLEVPVTGPICDSCANPIRQGLATVRVPQTDGTTRVYHAECWDREAGERA